MSNLARWSVLLLCALLASCATGAETTAAIGAGVAGLGALFNELAGSGVMTPVQNLQAQHALETIAATVSATQQAAQLAQQTAEAAKNGTMTPTQVGGTVAAGMAVLHQVRNMTRKKALGKSAA